MYFDLTPEAVGLALTPAAIVGCILLLESRRPYANAFSFAAAFVVVYGAISVMVLSIAPADADSPDSSQAQSIAALSIGALFLVVGFVMVFRHRHHGEGPPRWAVMLESAHPSGAFIAGVVLSIANPNLFLLLSGLGVIGTESATRTEQLDGVLFLLGAVSLDFVLPVAVFALFGSRATEWLGRAQAWMIGHDRQLTLAILFAFGALFTIRGAAGLV